MVSFATISTRIFRRDFTLRTFRFQIKYHPTLSRDNEARFREHLQKRLDVFDELTSQDALGDKLNLDYNNCEKIIKFMDAVVIRLEGGSQENIDVMLQEPVSDESLDELRKKETTATKTV